MNQRPIAVIVLASLGCALAGLDDECEPCQHVLKELASDNTGATTAAMLTRYLA